MSQKEIWTLDSQQLSVFKLTFKTITAEATPLLAWFPELKAPVLSRFACQVSNAIVLFQNTAVKPHPPNM